MSGARPMDDAQQPAEEEDTPLFMTSMPTRANAGLDALAAIIDEDEEIDVAAASTADNGGDPPVPSLQVLQRPMRKKRGIGAMQIALALTGLEPAAAQAGRANVNDDGSTTAKRSRR